MNIGIVTSIYNGYGRYIPRWAESVLNLSIAPAVVTLVLSGADHGLDVGRWERIRTRMEARRIVVNVVNIPHEGMGRARNAAVEATKTEWIMYLDADDTVSVHAIDNMRGLHRKADVIVTGLRVREENGRTRSRIFRGACRDKVLNGTHCCCSHSPFRRKFWEKSPWIESNDYIEQAFWIGLAKAGARFVATGSVCTEYHKHKDSFTGKMKAKDWKFAARQRAELRASNDRPPQEISAMFTENGMKISEQFSFGENVIFKLEVDN